MTRAPSTRAPMTRSQVMARVKSVDTGPEMRVRRALWRAGLRYRLHDKALPGKPDLVFPGRRAVLFIHGCFWHGHDCPRGARPPKNNADYWRGKIARNQARDAANAARLAAAGWTVLAVWECELKQPQRLEQLAATIRALPPVKKTPAVLPTAAEAPFSPPTERPAMPDTVLTLIAADLAPGAAAAVRDALEALGAETEKPDWLAPGVACDLAFNGLAAEQAEAAARDALGDAPVDLCAQPLAGRRKKLLVADMESTIIQQEMLDELGDYVGMKEKIAAITARAMNGEIDFEGALKERVALLAGLSADVLDEVWRRATLMPGAQQLVATMSGHGADCLLVSGGFRCFTRRVKVWLGFVEERGNDLEIADGKLTGRPTLPILDKNSKLEALMEASAARRLPLTAAITVGDGANDLPMLLAAGLGVAYHAKPVVAAQARARINHGDLTALLYLQGYRAADFRTA